MKVADGRGSNWESTLPGVADDAEQADGENILDFYQAIDKARALARGGRGDGRPETLAEAVDSYERALHARGGAVANSARVRYHLPPNLLSKPVPLFNRPRPAALARQAPKLRNEARDRVADD